jgi:hypothetical protein
MTHCARKFTRPRKYARRSFGQGVSPQVTRPVPTNDAGSEALTRRVTHIGPISDALHHQPGTGTRGTMGAAGDESLRMIGDNHSKTSPGQRPRVGPGADVTFRTYVTPDTCYFARASRAPANYSGPNFSPRVSDFPLRPPRRAARCGVCTPLTSTPAGGHRFPERAATTSRTGLNRAFLLCVCQGRIPFSGGAPLESREEPAGR